MKIILVYIFSILFLEAILLSGCKGRETGIIKNTGDLIGTNVIEHNTGIINNNGIGIFEYPSFDADIIERIDRGILVTVLGRSMDRMFFGGYDSFWLKIKVNNIEGWSYGAYVNLHDSQYENMSVISDTRQMNIVDLNWSRNLPEYELVQKERKAIRLQADRFMDISIQEFYNAIVSTFNLQQSLRPFFLNTHETGLTETDIFNYFSSSSLSDFIQASYVDNITISPLITINEDSASFVINGFRKMATFTGIEIGALAVNIKRIDSTSFIPLNGKTVIDSITISPYSAEDFIELSWGDVDSFNAFMTIGTYHSQRTSFLKMILGD